MIAEEFDELAGVPAAQRRTWGRGNKGPTFISGTQIVATHLPNDKAIMQTILDMIAEKLDELAGVPAVQRRTWGRGNKGPTSIPETQIIAVHPSNHNIIMQMKNLGEG